MTGWNEGKNRIFVDSLYSSSSGGNGLDFLFIIRGFAKPGNAQTRQHQANGNIEYPGIES